MSWSKTGRAERATGTVVGRICRSRSPGRTQESSRASFPSHKESGLQRKPFPSPAAPGAAAARVAPGAGGSRRTPAAAGGGGARCSSAVSDCSWWPSGKGQSTGSHHLPGQAGTLLQWGHRTQKAELESQGLQVRQGQGPCAGTELRGGFSSRRAQGWHLGSWAGTVTPRAALKDRHLSHRAKVLGKEPFAHPVPPSCGSAGTAGDSVPAQGTSLSVAPAGTNGHSSSAGPAGTEGQGGSPGQPCQEKDLVQRPRDLHPTAFMGQEILDWIKNTGSTLSVLEGFWHREGPDSSLWL